MSVAFFVLYIHGRRHMQILPVQWYPHQTPQQIHKPITTLQDDRNACKLCPIHTIPTYYLTT